MISVSSFSRFLNTQSGIVPLEVAGFACDAIVLVIVVVVVRIFIAGIVTMATVVLGVGVVAKCSSRHCRLFNSLQRLICNIFFLISSV